jgi:ubiquinone/menaquinone biosynthesis C-methylase UbiE
MDCYKGFAAVYDLFMAKDVPYDAWAAYIDNCIKAKGKADIVLDLACGTGNITLRMAKRGYDMIGVDFSEDMLMQAQNKACEQGHKVLWLAQDMRSLDLYGTVDAALCVCDGLNYLLEPSELKEVFRRVRLFLNPDGIFIFDMNTEYKFREVMGESAFGGKAEGAVFHWDNYYDPEKMINEYKVQFITQNEGEFYETHRQRAYKINDVVRWLTEAGFGEIRLRNNYSDEPLKADTARAVFICNTNSK